MKRSSALWWWLSQRQILTILMYTTNLTVDLMVRHPRSPEWLPATCWANRKSLEPKPVSAERATQSFTAAWKLGDAPPLGDEEQWFKEETFADMKRSNKPSYWDEPLKFHSVLLYRITDPIPPGSQNLGKAGVRTLGWWFFHQKWASKGGKETWFTASVVTGSLCFASS